VGDPNVAVRLDDPELDVVSDAITDRRIFGRLHPGPIVWVDEREERLGGVGECARVDSEDPMRLVGSQGLAGDEVPFPAADPGDPLGLGQVALAAAQT
jgi:hypothetical protein